MATGTKAVRAWVAGLRPPPERSARLRDALLWGVLVTPVLAQAGVRAVTDAPWWPLVVGAVVLAATVRVSRAGPVLALIVSVGLVLIDPSFAWAPPLMSYLAGRRSAGSRPPALGFVVILLAGTVLATLGLVGWVYWVVGFAFLGITPWLLGRYRRQYVALVHAGWERAEQLEREQRSISERARLRERARISRDMHDSLGHELSLIALRAGGLELAGELDDQHSMAAELRRRAGAATEQLREIIGVLREDVEAPSIEPSSHSVAELVQRCRDAGMTVVLGEDESEGSAPPMVDLATFRIVQEALTNAAKHAPGADVTVSVRRTGVQTTVSVVNPLSGGQGGSSDSAGPDRGHDRQGLLGLQERARLLGGTVTGRTRAGAFEVTARLPHGSDPSPAQEVRPSGELETESTLQRAHAHREVRRSLMVAVTGSALMAAVILTVQVFVWIHNAERSFLPPARFGRVVVGQDRSRVVELLPPEQIPARPERPEPPVPPQASCEYYSADANAFGTGAIYRLCFAGGELVSKDVLLEAGNENGGGA